MYFTEPKGNTSGSLCCQANSPREPQEINPNHSADKRGGWLEFHSLLPTFELHLQCCLQGPTKELKSSRQSTGKKLVFVAGERKKEIIWSSAPGAHLECVHHPSPCRVIEHTVTKLQLKLDAVAYIWETNNSLC